MKAPSFVTIGNFIRDELAVSVELIFNDINRYIFYKEQVDLANTYIDGTKLEANMPTVTYGYGKSHVSGIEIKYLKKYLPL